MSLNTLLVVLIVVGAALYLVGLIPMDPKVLAIIRVVVILALVLWVLGLFFDLDAFYVGRRHAR